MKRATVAPLVVRALRSMQGDIPVYILFLRGTDLLQIADFSRMERGKGRELQGFQRKEIRAHVNAIAQYLGSSNRLFPNAIILALSPDVVFKQSRGPDGELSFDTTDAGKLTIPIREEGDRVAWIVDGQQRSLALSKAGSSTLLVPVVAFATDSIQTQREQFILVNRAKPLPQRLINELLPETTGVVLPRDLQLRQIPSRLCEALDTDKHSPFCGLIRRPSQIGEPKRVVIDSALTSMIRRSLGNPTGALAGFKALGDQSGNTKEMLAMLCDFWNAAKETFPDAWGKPPAESRLMHSAGLAAMGDLMDRIAARAVSTKGLKKFFSTELKRIADDCAWTSGSWPLIDRAWDEIENTHRDVKMLSQVLVQLYAQRVMQ